MSNPNTTERQILLASYLLGCSTLLLLPLSLSLVLRPVPGLQRHHAGLTNVGVAGVEGIQGVRIYHGRKLDLLSVFPDLIALAICPGLAPLAVGGMHNDRIGCRRC